MPSSSSGAPLLTDWTLPDANIHAIHLERNQLSVKLRTFADFLGEFLRGYFEDLCSRADEATRMSVARLPVKPLPLHQSTPI